MESKSDTISPEKTRLKKNLGMIGRFIGRITSHSSLYEGEQKKSPPPEIQHFIDLGSLRRARPVPLAHMPPFKAPGLIIRPETVRYLREQLAETTTEAGTEGQ